MAQTYQIISRTTTVKNSGFLAVGIMDTGSKEELENTIAWYRQFFNYDIHVITQSNRFSHDTMKTVFPQVTFIVFEKLPSLAERINSLSNVCMTTFFLLVRSDTDLVELNWNAVSSIMNQEIHPVCLTPLIFNKDKELIPTVRSPQIKNNNINPLSFMPSKGNDNTLYPFLGIGLYDRALFQRLRGFDEELTGAYWQALDFGTKCWLYGYSLASVNSIAFIFPRKQFLIEDRSEKENTGRFYTKALGVKLVRGRIHAKKVPGTDKHVLAEEVKSKLTLYRTDFENLAADWKIPEN